MRKALILAAALIIAPISIPAVTMLIGLPIFDFVLTYITIVAKAQAAGIIVLAPILGACWLIERLR